MFSIDSKDFRVSAAARIEQYRIEGNRIAFTSTGCFVEFFTKEVNSEI